MLLYQSTFISTINATENISALKNCGRHTWTVSRLGKNIQKKWISTLVKVSIPWRLCRQGKAIPINYYAAIYLLIKIP